MPYIDPNAAGQVFGTYQINETAPALRWIGQENSANGAGPEETYKRQGDARGVTRRCHAFERSYCLDSRSASSLPDRDRATARAAGCKGRYRRSAFRHTGGLI